MRRGRTSTIPRLPDRLGGQESARISGGGLGRGYGGQQGGHDGGLAGGGGGGEDASIETGEGGEESERSTTLTSATGGSAEVCTLYNVRPLRVSDGKRLYIYF